MSELFNGLSMKGERFAMRLSEHLVTVYRLIRELVDELAAARGLTTSQLMTLRYVAHHPGCAMREVTVHLRVTRGAMTSIVDRLEELGWVERTAGADRRVFHLALTPVGRERYQAVHDELRLRIDAWASPLAPDVAEGLARGLEALEALRAGSLVR